MNCLLGLSTWCSMPPASNSMAQKVRKPMLYPLSYEGQASRLPSVSGKC